MRQPSNLEGLHKSSGDNPEREGEFGSFFPFAPPRIRLQRNTIRHTSTRLFTNRKGEAIAGETKDTINIEKNVPNSFLSDFSSLKNSASVYQNGSNVDIRNPNSSDYVKDCGFRFRPVNGNAPDHGDNFMSLTGNSFGEKDQRKLLTNDEISYCDTTDSGGLGVRSKSTLSQREGLRNCFLSSFSVVGVGAGLSLSQRGRFQKSMEAGSLSHKQVKLKLLELLQYWMSSPSVRLQIHTIVQDILLQAGLNPSPVQEAWHETCRPSYYKDEETSNMGGAQKSDSNSVTNSSTCVGSHETSSEIHLSRSSPLEGQKGSDANTAIDPDHSFHSFSTPSPPAFVRTSKTSPRGVICKVENITRQETECLHSLSQKITQVTSGGRNTASRLSYSPSSTHRSLFDAGEPQHNGSLVSQNLIVNVLHTSGKEAEKSKIGYSARYDSWGSFSREIDGDVATTLEVKVSNQKAPGASYKDIPQFYFPLGRPTTQASVISRPLSSKIQNPHLKMLESVPFVGAMYDTTEPLYDSVASSAGGDKTSMHRDSTIPSMSTLRCMEDKSVSPYLHKEFLRILTPHRLSSKAYLLESQLNALQRSPHLTKREASYKHCLIECIERICVNCFGVPRYFAYVILYLILNEFALNSDISRPPAGGSFDFSSFMHGSVSWAFMKKITAQHLMEFYDAYLKGTDSIRRTFDLLILSSNLKSDGAAAGSQRSQHQPFPQRTTTLRTFLLPEDFSEYIGILLQHHPGLSFLKKTPEFRPKYMNMVIYRIFYELDRYDWGRITFAAFSSSRLMDAFRQVDATPDINSVLLFFSYEHFYVLYCRFWELDEDCDMMISKKDFARYYPDDTFNPLIIQRIFSGVGRRIRCGVEGYMGYEDFVWFCLSEEDKSTPQAIRYWFRILDLDGDGVLSIYEMETFYHMVEERVTLLGGSPVSFEDVLRQGFDMVRCPAYRGLTLADLLCNPEAAHVLLNMLTNLVRLLQYEQSDPLVVHPERLMGGPMQSHWDRFARAEYDRMAQENDT
ncbi:unnamed protein product [Phytomonas sp. Hart1]|nr:unnamed protein product [Phytomonas sp. Hart1]|eukprot:CCW69724.1 unnamed protein product [Phytomonas sp. isolate Hart1]